MTRVNVISKKNFTHEEEILLTKSVELIELVINSDIFRKKVEEFVFNGKKQFYFNRGLTNEQICNLILSGKEEPNNQIDFELDFVLEVSNHCPRGVVGTTYGRRRTETYRCKLNDMNASEYAGHLMHEYCHYLGFTHTEEYTDIRKYTVPYAIGYLVRDLSTLLLLDISSDELNTLLGGISLQSNKIKSFNSLNKRDNYSSSVFNSISEIASMIEENNEVRFWESAIIYNLRRDNPFYEQSIAILNESVRIGKPIEVVYDKVTNEIIEINYSDIEINKEYYEIIEKNELAYLENKSNIDLSEATLIPEIESKEKLQLIFQYIQNQDCRNSNCEIDVCIPFYYKIDGCYARAHKMRYIIENIFGYRCQKIFSYDSITPRNDSNRFVLSVKSDTKCIFWWYHVAPIVNVNEGNKVISYIIDPSVANKPLSIQEWVEIQENKSCSQNARVGSTEIRESYVYYPNGTRDDFYIHTNKILKAYR